MYIMNLKDDLMRFAMEVAHLSAPFHISKEREGVIEIVAADGRLYALHYVMTQWHNTQFILIDEDGKPLSRGYYRFSECPMG